MAESNRQCRCAKAFGDCCSQGRRKKRSRGWNQLAEHADADADADTETQQTQAQIKNRARSNSATSTAATGGCHLPQGREQVAAKEDQGHRKSSDSLVGRLGP